MSLGFNIFPFFFSRLSQSLRRPNTSPWRSPKYFHNDTEFPSNLSLSFLYRALFPFPTPYTPHSPPILTNQSRVLLPLQLPWIYFLSVVSFFYFSNLHFPFRTSSAGTYHQILSLSFLYLIPLILAVSHISFPQIPLPSTNLSPYGVWLLFCCFTCPSHSYSTSHTCVTSCNHLACGDTPHGHCFRHVHLPHRKSCSHSCAPAISPHASNAPQTPLLSAYIPHTYWFTWLTRPSPDSWDASA